MIIARVVITHVITDVNVMLIPTAAPVDSSSLDLLLPAEMMI